MPALRALDHEVPLIGDAAERETRRAPSAVPVVLAGRAADPRVVASLFRLPKGLAIVAIPGPFRGHRIRADPALAGLASRPDPDLFRRLFPVAHRNSSAKARPLVAAGHGSIDHNLTRMPIEASKRPSSAVPRRGRRCASGGQPAGGGGGGVTTRWRPRGADLRQLRRRGVRGVRVGRRRGARTRGVDAPGRAGGSEAECGGVEWE